MEIGTSRQLHQSRLVLLKKKVIEVFAKYLLAPAESC